MKKILGTKSIVTLFATLFIASTSFVGCVSTDDGETIDPAVVASAEATSNTNSNTGAAESTVEAGGENSVAKEATEAEAANISLDASTEPQAASASNTGEQSSVDVAADAAPSNSETAALTDAISAPAEGSAEADPFAPIAANTAAPAGEAASAETAPTDQAVQTDQPEQAAQSDQPNQADQAAQPDPVSQGEQGKQVAESAVPAPQASQESQVVSAIPEDGSMVPYHVRKGDTLASIAGRIFGNAARWRELAEQNNIVNPDLIYVGDVLLYRMSAKAKEFATKQDSVTKKVVKVASGESLWTIAERELGNAAAWRVIWKDNPSIKNPDVIHAGMQLVVTNWMHVAQGGH